jgi:hypothetical protein
LIPRFLIALPAAALLSGLSYWSAAALPVAPVDRIAIGLALEREHDFSGAEHELLAAADRDHQYQPRWTLAGFYFRRDRPDDFWLWTRKALEVGTRDLGALFDLCWQAANNRATIWTRAMPDRKEIWNEYLAYLLTTAHWDAAAGTAGKLVQRATAEDSHMLLGFCDLAIERKDAAAAVPVWNGLCARGLIASTALGNGHYLANGDLSRRPLGRGFDWRLPTVAGARQEWTPGELHISLSGNQAGGSELVVQHLAFAAGERYRFRYSYRTQGAPGLRWRVSGAESQPLASDAWANGTLSFDGNVRTLRLVCDDGRSPGTVVLREMDIVRE